MSRMTKRRLQEVLGAIMTEVDGPPRAIVAFLEVEGAVGTPGDCEDCPLVAFIKRRRPHAQQVAICSADGGSGWVVLLREGRLSVTLPLSEAQTRVAVGFDRRRYIQLERRDADDRMSWLNHGVVAVIDVKKGELVEVAA